MYNKTIMKYHLTSIRRATIKKNPENKCWQGCGKIGTVVQCWWECKMVYLWKTVWRFLEKLETETPQNLGIYPKELKAES